MLITSLRPIEEEYKKIFAIFSYFCFGFGPLQVAARVLRRKDTLLFTK